MEVINVNFTFLHSQENLVQRLQTDENHSRRDAKRCEDHRKHWIQSLKKIELFHPQRHLKKFATKLHLSSENLSFSRRHVYGNRNATYLSSLGKRRLKEVNAMTSRGPISRTPTYLNPRNLFRSKEFAVENETPDRYIPNFHINGERIKYTIWIEKS